MLDDESGLAGSLMRKPARGPTSSVGEEVVARVLFIGRSPTLLGVVSRQSIRDSADLDHRLFRR